MGDTGSTFLGFVLAVISIPGDMKSVTVIAIAVPLLIFGVPLFDIIYAIIRRVAKKRNPMSPDREHLHHKLIDLGLSQRQSVVVMYILSALLGVCAILLADRGALSAIILVVSVVVFIFAGSKVMREIKHEDSEDKEENKQEEHLEDDNIDDNEENDDDKAGKKSE
jgi:UDP-GlcNAc:undecaprenyl-phosphate GlcNAc-1-phosphate transferase